MKEISLEEYLDTIKNPIEIETKTLGNIYFRHVFDEDYLFIKKCIDENTDSESFCKQFFIHQSDDSTVTLENLNKLEDKEIQLLIKKYIEMEHLGECFDFSDSNDIYMTFKEGMVSYINQIDSNMAKNKAALLKNADSIVKSYSTLNESILSCLRISTETYINAMSTPSKLSGMNNQNEILNLNSHVSNIVNSSAISHVMMASEIVEQQTNIWKTWMRTNNDFIQASKILAEYWNEFEKEYDISSLKVQKYLKNYNWFVSPNMDRTVVYDILSICENPSEDKQDKINKIIVDYFLDNNCKELDIWFNKWSCNPLFDKRIDIIKDCINAIKNKDETIHFPNIIIPSLICQIEGIQTDYMVSNGVRFKKMHAYDPNGNQIKKKEYFRTYTSDNKFYDAMNEYFLDVLFQETYYGEECTTTDFSRNKILHGENTDYGRNDNMIRCFMILDFLSELTLINDDNK